MGVDWMGQRSQFEKAIFWKIVPIPCAPPPTQQNWETRDIKQLLDNDHIANPDLFDLKVGVLVNILYGHRLPIPQPRGELDTTPSGNRKIGICAHVRHICCTVPVKNKLSVSFPIQYISMEYLWVIFSRREAENRGVTSQNNKNGSFLCNLLTHKNTGKCHLIIKMVFSASLYPNDHSEPSFIEMHWNRGECISNMWYSYN